MHHLLDEPSLPSQLDPLGILKLTDGFPAQCAASIARALPGVHGAYDGIWFMGVGGSAAAGDYLQVLCDRFGTIPLRVVRGYDAPKWISKASLVIASSYSGNTEETLSAYEQARETGATVVAITSGGELAKRAVENGNLLVNIPGGQPPRTALGYSLFTALKLLETAALLELPPWHHLPDFLSNEAMTWGIAVPFESNQAKQLADMMIRTTPVMYGLGDWQGVVARRWKAQINENAKSMAFAHELPEMNHNELLGWLGAEGSWSCFILEGGDESPQMLRRATFTLGTLPKDVHALAIQASGKTLLERMMSLTLLGDYASVYLAYMRGVDPGDISLLDSLKSHLAQR